jgi:hypothetical protein
VAVPQILKRNADLSCDTDTWDMYCVVFIYMLLNGAVRSSYCTASTYVIFQNATYNRINLSLEMFAINYTQVIMQAAALPTQDSR